MKLREYQEEVITKVTTALKTSNHCVIAACPSSGKTFTTLEFIKRTKGTFLILTHGQIVLRNQWAVEVDAHLKGKDKKRVTYTLPHSIVNKDIKEYDYVVIDEAHEFTFAPMVQKILQVNEKAKKIYLTGTPSEFVRLGYPIVVVPALRLLSEGFISDLSMNLFSTSANIGRRDRNSSEDLTERGAKKLEKTVGKDLESLLTSLLEKTSLTRNKDSWKQTLNSLHKTMIACASIAQSERVVAYFKSKGVSAVASNSVNDPETLNIQRFMDDATIKVLVVVDRGILGFNMPNLVNVVDMTCSHNINRLYQLFARVMRLNPEHPQKYFFKLAKQSEVGTTEFFLAASMHLMSEDFITKYNGKNLNGMQIVVKAEVTEKEDIDSRSEGGGGNTTASNKARKYRIDSELYNTVASARLFGEMLAEAGAPHSLYKQVSLGEAKNRLLGAIVYMPDERKRQLIELAKSGAPKPPMGHPLGSVVRHYTRQSSESYDTLFTEALKSLRPDWFPQRKSVMEYKQEILEIARQGGPPLGEAHPLYGRWAEYSSPSRRGFDPVFVQEAHRLNPKWRPTREKYEDKLSDLFKLAKSGAPRPKGQSSLGHVLRNLPMQRPEMLRELIEIRPDWFGSGYQHRRGK